MIRMESHAGSGWAMYLFAISCALTPAHHALGDAFDGYRLAESFPMPDGFGPLDILADGRIITVVGLDILTETGPGTRDFQVIGTLTGADLNAFGAAFIQVSPDDSMVAMGNNGGVSFNNYQVGVFNLHTHSEAWFQANHFLAEWLDDTRLVITASDFAGGSSVTVLDTTSADPANPVNPEIIANVGGASGGITFDTNGNLYTGNGFASFGPSTTGAVKAFSQSSLSAAISGGTVIDFEAGGLLVVDLLGAAPLGFDAEQNLLVGGGGEAPDNDAVAVVRAAALADALSGLGVVDTSDPTRVRRFDPISTNDFNFFSVAYNSAFGELYVRDYGDPIVYVYRDLADVPTLSHWGLAVMVLLMLTLGTLQLRHRFATAESPSR